MWCSPDRLLLRGGARQAVRKTGSDPLGPGGYMQIYRMKADGSQQTRMAHDDAQGDWRLHPTPDGEWVLFLSFTAMSWAIRPGSMCVCAGCR